MQIIDLSVSFLQNTLHAKQLNLSRPTHLAANLTIGRNAPYVFCSRKHSEGFPFIVGGLGLDLCSRRVCRVVVALQIFLEPKAPQDSGVILHMLKCEMLCNLLQLYCMTSGVQKE